MSNPIGYSTQAGPPQGLDYGGTPVTGGPPNLVGGLSDPTRSGNSARYWYLVPAGVVGGLVGYPGTLPRCSPTPMTAIGALDGQTYPYGQMNENGPVTPSFTSGQASAIAAGANCEFVTVVIGIQVQMFGGFPYCDDVNTDPPVLNSLTVTVGGAPADLMGMTSGSYLPASCATYTPTVIYNATTGGPFISGMLMRPTALSWPYQDPDNQFNRAIWHKAEIGSITWALDAYTFSWQVDASYTVFGYRRYTSFPTSCPIHLGIGGLRPGSVDAGVGPSGVLGRSGIVGSASTVSGEGVGVSMPGAGNPPSDNNAANSPGVSEAGADSGGPGWSMTGATYYNDPPPGAGNLEAPGYHFAELGTATRGGVATGTGNLAQVFGLSGELPMGTQVDIEYGGRVITADKQDRGYGQGGDGIHSDPAYSIDLYDGSASGLADARGALGFPGSGQVRVRLHRGVSAPASGVVRDTPHAAPTPAAPKYKPGTLNPGG